MEVLKHILWVVTYSFMCRLQSYVYRHQAIYLSLYLFTYEYVMYVRKCILPLKSKCHVWISYTEELLGKCLWIKKRKNLKEAGRTIRQWCRTKPWEGEGRKEKGKEGWIGRMVDAAVFRQFQPDQWLDVPPTKAAYQRSPASFRNGHALVILPLGENNSWGGSQQNCRGGVYNPGAGALNAIIIPTEGNLRGPFSWTPQNTHTHKLGQK